MSSAPASVGCAVSVIRLPSATASVRTPLIVAVGLDADLEPLAAAVGAGDKHWRAYLSTQAVAGKPAVNARDRIGKGPWYNAKGALVATSVSHLHGDKLKEARIGNALNWATALTEKGEPVKRTGDTPNEHDILTGSQPDGRAFGNADDRTCKNWTSSTQGAAMVNAVDWLFTRLRVDGEVLDLAGSTFTGFRRVLDMRRGVLTRELTWETAGGKRLKVTFLRFTAMHATRVGCQRVTVEPLNFSGEVHLRCGLDFDTHYEIGAGWDQTGTGLARAKHINFWTCDRKGAAGEGWGEIAYQDAFRMEARTPFCGLPFWCTAIESTPRPVLFTPISGTSSILLLLR